MPPQDDHSDGPSTLPPPDLNPLLNPLLGQNMGRWAEVYFTSAPEKREQAVLDLLRELQTENLASEAGPQSSVSKQVAEPGAEMAEVRAVLVRCHACGRENPASHRFCGMCGKAVAAREMAADEHVLELPVPDFGVADFSAADLSADLDSADLDSANLDSAVTSVEPQQIRYPLPSEPAPAKESPQPPSVREDHYHAGYAGGILDPTPASRPYRVYLVIGLALVLLALAYMTWRSMQAAQTSLVAPQTQPAVVSQPIVQTPTPSATPAPTSPKLSKITPARNLPASNQAAVPSRDGASRAASTPLIPGTNPSAEGLAESGGEELAMAQRYLNGTDGQERNSAEAAKLLWKAIAKHNGEATLLLSDLYLKGDGVAKNCDQARVLLDAAAGRGVKGAAERLQHLQAFGCS